jgi:hypothetical protein
MESNNLSNFLENRNVKYAKVLVSTNPDHMSQLQNERPIMVDDFLGNSFQMSLHEFRKCKRVAAYQKCFMNTTFSNPATHRFDSKYNYYVWGPLVIRTTYTMSFPIYNGEVTKPIISFEDGPSHSSLLTLLITFNLATISSGKICVTLGDMRTFELSDFFFPRALP